MNGQAMHVKLVLSEHPGGELAVGKVGGAVAQCFHIGDDEEECEEIIEEVHDDIIRQRMKRTFCSASPSF